MNWDLFDPGAELSDGKLVAKDKAKAKSFSKMAERLRSKTIMM